MIPVRLHPDVSSAIAEGRAVVALESTLVSHGLPRPENLRVAMEIEAMVRRNGGVPATIAILDGVVRIGLTPPELEQIAVRDDIKKVSVRDLGTVIALGGSGATTVAATSHLATVNGIRFFATGGLGGVHREARQTWDESADLLTLAQDPIAVVCSGVKSVLDVPATLERFETLGIAVVGYQTNRFPGFYLTDSGYDLEWRIESPQDVAAIIAARDAIKVRTSLVVANPLPSDGQVDPDLHDRVLEEGLLLAHKRGIRGKDVTPFLLDYFHRSTHGASLEANTAMVLRNAALAAQAAVAWCDRTE